VFHRGVVETSAYQKMIKQRHSPNDYTKIAVIGRGAFGEVRLVKENSTGNIMAMKILSKSEMLKKNQVSHVWAERDILAISSNTPWTVQLYCSFQDDEYLYLVMEYLAGGDMMTWLIIKEIFAEDVVRFYISELWLALDVVYKLDYVHR